MLGNLATKLALALLDYSRLSNENRQLLTASLLHQLGAVPLRAKVVVDDLHQVFIDGKPMTMETSRLMHEGSKALLRNFARKVVREQVTFMAITKGVHENISPEQGLFAKAALWAMQEEDELYVKFAMFEIEQDDQ